MANDRKNVGRRDQPRPRGRGPRQRLAAGYRRAGCDFVSRRISLSNTAPEHIARAAEAEGRLKIIRPGEH
ncbi:MAG TPA: hypothetical protein ENN51_07945 [candidate division WOR-3 bacterium]|uniref:Uncharacterized protein n=1 Tax=candidate division WOR-3 bacterium TaxID=2052148 RepID=A0A7V0T750_UNCW3|nr:hypothetical protein [candidate division WOR-3 bacterium]